MKGTHDMSCDICGRNSCTTLFHSFEEQARYEVVIAAFDRARELRAMVKDELDKIDDGDEPKFDAAMERK